MAVEDERQKNILSRQLVCLQRFAHITRADVKWKNYKPDSEGNIIIDANLDGFTLSSPLTVSALDWEKGMNKIVAGAYYDCVRLNVRFKAEEIAEDIRGPRIKPITAKDWEINP